MRVRARQFGLAISFHDILRQALRAEAFLASYGALLRQETRLCGVTHPAVGQALETAVPCQVLLLLWKKS